MCMFSRNGLDSKGGRGALEGQDGARITRHEDSLRARNWLAEEEEIVLVIGWIINKVGGKAWIWRRKDQCNDQFFPLCRLFRFSTF